MVSPSLTLHLASTAATRRLGNVLGRLLPSGTVILLEGQLGSGKTTFVQGIGEALGIAEPLVSPTFTLVSEYEEGRVPLYHFDLYRLESADVSRLYPEVYWEGVDFPLGIVAIEWSDRLLHPPESYLHIRLCYPDDEWLEFGDNSEEGLRNSKEGRCAILTAVGEVSLAWDDLKHEMIHSNP
jgi:tRNA threonylcarbamoyladenosine biosynthesis protein TsaE